MKAIFLLLLGATVLAMTGCESEVPREPDRPAIKFGNDQFRDDTHDRAVPPATDREKTNW